MFGGVQAGLKVPCLFFLLTTQPEPFFIRDSE